MPDPTQAQLILIEGVRIEPPACFDQVADAIENALENGNAEINNWSDLDLAHDIFCWAEIDEAHTRADIERAIRIYRERNQSEDL